MADAERPGFLFPYYSYRAWGPNWPQGTFIGRDFDTAGNRFNPNKSALDPYALESFARPALNSLRYRGAVYDRQPSTQIVFCSGAQRRDCRGPQTPLSSFAYSRF
jgi:hypothetical protein